MSPLSLDDVVALNALIVTAIGLTFVLGRKERKTPTLDLRHRRRTALDEAESTRNSSPHEVLAPMPYAPRAGSKRVGEDYGAAALRRLEDEEASQIMVSIAESRELNVFFNWNGHTWDAYEVLGVPAGESRDKVVAAFHRCRAKSPESIAFLQAAADAILKARR